MNDENKLNKLYFIDSIVEEVREKYPELYHKMSEDYQNDRFSKVQFFEYFKNLVCEDKDFSTYDDVIKYIKENENLIDFWIF